MQAAAAPKIERKPARPQYRPNDDYRQLLDKITANPEKSLLRVVTAKTAAPRS